MSDRQALFKAAKAQRASSSAPSKEQLKALRAKKAKAAAEADSTAARLEPEGRRPDEAAGSMATDQASRLPPRPVISNMGPPASRPAAPRPATASVGSAPGIVLRRTDSQRTRMGRNASIAPEPAGQSNASSGAVPFEPFEPLPPVMEDREQSVGSIPANFFDQQQQHSGGQQASADTAERIGSNAEVHSEVASALARGSSVEAISAHTRLPVDFFEAAGSTEGEPQAHVGDAEPSTNSVRHDEAGPSRPILPQGFFANKDADARARGLEPARKKTKEEEYKDFMSAIATDVKEAEAAEEADALQAAEERAAREAHEQQVRAERVAMLANGNGHLPDARAALYSEAEAHIDLPTLSEISRKRGRENGNGAVQGDEASSSEDDPDADLDWRSKTL